MRAGASSSFIYGPMIQMGIPRSAIGIISLSGRLIKMEIDMQVMLTATIQTQPSILTLWIHAMILMTTATLRQSMEQARISPLEIFNLGYVREAPRYA